MKIVIDPGHGGSDPGAVANGYKEKDLNLSLSLKIRDILKDYAEVILTRDKDIDFGLASRGSYIGSLNPDLCLSIHFNSFDGTARGVESIHSIHAPDDIKNLAENITQSIALLGIPYRRVFSRESTVRSGVDYYGVIRRGGKNTIIVESLFLDNTDDVAKLNEPGFIDRLASRITEAVITHYKLTKEEMTVEDAVDICYGKVLIERDKWIRKAYADRDVYWLLYKTAKYILSNSVK